jgi:hypothetical protein
MLSKVFFAFIVAAKEMYGTVGHANGYLVIRDFYNCAEFHVSSSARG